jgi:hypothetical protein
MLQDYDRTQPKSNIMSEDTFQPLTDLAPHALKAEAICSASSYASLYVFQTYGPNY